MKINPYLHYNGNCGAALKYYEKVLGAKATMVMPFGAGPPEMQLPPDWKDKVMHAAITIDGEVLMLSDAPPGHFQKPQGFSVALQFADAADAEARFKALADGGSITMPFAKTFFSKGFGMCVDQFGIPWMVNCPNDGI